MPFSHSALRSLVTRLPFFYGWVVVAVAFLTIGVGVNSRTAFSLLFPPILDEFGWTRGVTAAAFSIGFISSTLYTPLIGHLMDRFGPRYVIPFGAVLVSGGLTLATMAYEPWHIILTLGVLVVGASTFLSYIGHFVFLPNWFERKRGLAIGIAMSGIGVGSILLLPWLQAAIDSVGWRQGCLALAIIILVVVVPLNFLFQRQRPEDLGLAPDGDTVLDDGRKDGRQRDNVVDRAWAAIDWTLPRALKTARFWLLASGFFCAMFAWYGILVHQTKYLLDAGFDTELAAYALGLVGLLGIGAQIGLGHVSDRIGREWVWMVCCLGFAISYAAMIAIKQFPTHLLLYLMVGAQGLIGYGLPSVYSAVPAEIFQGKHFGTIFGTLAVAGSAGAAAGPWLAGSLYDATGSYSLPFAIAIGLSILSASCIWLAAPRKVRAVAGQMARMHRP